MKLTEERLVKMILEELDAMGEAYRGSAGQPLSRDQSDAERMKRRGTGTMTLDADHYAFVLPRRHSKWKSGIRVKDPYGWSKIPQDIKNELEGMAKRDAKLADAIAHAKELEQQKED
tara:strand:+ start:335 stop:685 length:351 start_codon:yes stop_codon:yes gene_type:complete